jgi:hypothetical protein
MDKLRGEEHADCFLKFCERLSALAAYSDKGLGAVGLLPGIPRSGRRRLLWA